jgi:hypothetical protein
VILNFICVDIFFTEKWFAPLLSKNMIDEVYHGINEFFEENGFESSILVINLGSSLVFLLIQFGILAIFAGIHLLGKSIS